MRSHEFEEAISGEFADRPVSALIDMAPRIMAYARSDGGGPDLRGRS
jgi:hypothetical protein